MLPLRDLATHRQIWYSATHQLLSTLRYRYLLLLPVLLLINISIADDIQDQLRFEPISLESLELDGDSVGLINSIVEDSQGFMWIGGDNGLVRYDGRKFKVFRHEQGNPSSLSSNQIADLIVDLDGVLWVATHSGLNAYSPESESFTRYQLKEYTPGERPQHVGLSSNSVNTLEVDDENVLYAGTSHGITAFSPKRDEVAHYFSINKDFHAQGEHQVYDLHIDNDGRLLIGTRQQGLQILNKETGRYHPYPFIEKHKALLTGKDVWGIVQDNKNNLWITGFNSDLIKILPDNSIIQYSHNPDDPNSLPYGFAWDIMLDKDQNIWLMYDKEGIAILNTTNNTFSELKANPFDRHAITSNQLRTAYSDSKGDIWLGYFTAEISFHNRNKEVIKNYYHRPDQNSLSDDGVLTFFESHDGYVWIGTENGLNKFDRESKAFKIFNSENTNQRLKSDTILSMAEDKHNNLLLGTSRAKMHIFNRFPESYTSFHQLPEPMQEGSHYFLWRILRDSQDRIWTGSLNDGVAIYNENLNQRTVLKHSDEDNALLNNYVSHIIEDTEGMFWIGTRGGLSKYDNQTKTFTHIHSNRNSIGTQNSAKITALKEAPDGNIWAGLINNGINIYTKPGKLVRSITIDDGLPSGTVTSLIDDDLGFRWAATLNGIARINLATYELVALQKQHGLAGNNHNRDATLKDSDGNLYFGSTEGFSMFHPSELQITEPTSRVAITDLYVNGKVVSEYGKNHVLDKAINTTRKLTLNHNHTSFGFDFSLLRYKGSKYHKYAYMLEGFEKNWHQNDRHHHANYTNIPPGKYIFKVKGMDSLGFWTQNITEVELDILPPPWRSWWAYLAYVLLLVLILKLLFHHNKKKVELANEKSINAELVKVANIKNTFLANTSHELRTPLNGIIGISDYLIDYVSKYSDTQLTSHLKRVSASGKRLSNLINDILDFSKLEDDSLILHKESVNINNLSREIFSILMSQEHSAQTELINKMSNESPKVLADPARLQQIILNLMGNAIKYTKEGEVILSNSFDEKEMTISIQDSGSGISEKELENIFGLFNQSSQTYGHEQGGVGLGLSITKQLINLHGGVISVNSVLGQGSVFTFTLPLATETNSKVSNPTPDTAELESTPSPTSGIDIRLTVLVVDDDPVNRIVMRRLLEKEYKVLEAKDGQDALDLLDSHQEVDLIVLDIMMPVLNGFEACKIIREEYTQEALPIVFVTARNLEEDLSLAFHLGGNDFIEKPISKHNFLPRVKNHLAKKERQKASPNTN